MKQLAFYLFIFVFSLTSCFTLQPVEFIKAENITTGRTDTSFEVKLDLAMHNPNKWGLKLKDISTQISLDDKPLGKANLAKVIKLKRKSDFTLPVLANASLTDLTALSAIGLGLLFGNQTSMATIKGTMTLKKFIFRRKVQFEYREKIDSKKLQSLF